MTLPSKEEKRRVSKIRYRRSHHEHIIKISKAWRSSNPEKRRAHYIVQNAIRFGRLVRPKNCSQCGLGDQIIEAHHEDYGKPLQIEWLCPSCHRRLAKVEKARTRLLDDQGRLQCMECREWLSLDHFHRNKSKACGYQSYCKLCWKQRSKAS